MTSRDEPIADSKRITRSLARALASRTNSATNRTDVTQAPQRSSVQRAGVTFARTNTLRRAARIISEDPTFSIGTQAVAENVLRGSEEGNATIEPQTMDWAPYIVSDIDEGSLLGSVDCVFGTRQRLGGRVDYSGRRITRSGECAADATDCILTAC
jgi:hypothetical protein